jgi:GcrA cell cycle regulator
MIGKITMALAKNSIEGMAKPFLERIENLNAAGESAKAVYMNECKARREDIKEVYTEAKDAGVPVKALKGLIKTARTDGPARGETMLDRVAVSELTKSRWTDQLKEKAKSLWLSNMSATEIADVFWREDRVSFTRNAVIGKLHRMGLTSQTSEREPRAKKPRPRMQSVGVMLKRIEGRQTHRKELPAPLVCEETFLGVALLDLKPFLSRDYNECRWPTGGEANPAETTFCGQQTMESGGSYCPFHFSIAYAKQRGGARARTRSARSRFGPRTSALRSPATASSP